MPVEGDGRFTWYEDRITDGIRQDVSESTNRYRVLRNASVVNMGSLVKDKGIRSLVSAQLSGGDTFGGIDARYNNGTQKIFVAHDNGSNGTIQALNTSGSYSWNQELNSLARVKPWMGMFANKLIVADGTTLRARDQDDNWTTPGNVLADDGSVTFTVNPSKFAVVYANRLVVFGDPAYPNYFYPSGVSDPTDWDASLAVKVTNANGEVITGAATCGRFLLVGGQNFIRSYYLGMASPRDWDWDSLSEQVGPVNWQSFVPVTRYQGSDAANFTFFWSNYGPAMVADTGGGPPSLIPLWDPIRRSVLGEAFQGMEGLELSRFANIEGTWCPEFNEVRFAVSFKDKTKNNALLCVNVDSAIGASQNQGFPIWRIRDNSNWVTGEGSLFPVSTVFSAEVDDNGAPTTTGKVRTFCAQDGKVYEMDARTNCKDDDTYAIKMQVRKDGYDGYEDGIREHEKSVRGMYIRTTQVGDFDLQMRIVADGGQDASFDSITTSSGQRKWGAGNSWGDGSLWNSAGEFVTEDVDFHCLGQKFDLEIYDNGEIEAPIEINSWSLWGYVEDRR